MASGRMGAHVLGGGMRMLASGGDYANGRERYRGWGGEG